MQVLLKVLIITKLFFCVVTSIVAQEYFAPISSYSFNNNSIVDDKGYSELSLFNQAGLYNDNERGYVLRFSAASKGYATINKKLLNTDSCTISFFFYWESSNATSWHQLFEIHDPTTNSNLFFTPQNGWGNNLCSLISNNKEYKSYEAVNARQLIKDTWMHIAITFKEKLVTIYINGIEESKVYINFAPSSITASSLFLGGNPYRSNNYYISARLDEIKIFDKALAANQVAALFQEIEIPEPENNETVWEVTTDPIEIEIDITDSRQIIQNFGSSDGWNTERIGKYWPENKKEKLAELLFSTEKDNDGNPKGIGLSAWRFNIGSGTFEQGDASRINKASRRTECFLNADGYSYNWNKQLGQQWFLKKAAIDYNINHIIGWQNSPPVLYTHNNLGFRDYGQPMSSILKDEYFDDFATFLADIIKHFKDEGIQFDYISPLNEPQYGWSTDGVGGTVSQEGTPWTNQEIHDVVDALDTEFTNKNIDTKIFISEAGSINYHTTSNGHAGNQLYNFWNQNSSLSLVNKSSFANIVSYHSYWKDFGSALVDERKAFFNQCVLLNPVPMAWQTEYSLLGSGYRDGYPTGYKLTEMECALSLSKVIMTDLNVTNATGWQWWTTFEQGKHGGESRFSLIEAYTKGDNSDGDYYLNKLFYTLGNFSHFIRPGMIRVNYSRSDNLTIAEEISDVIFSAYTNESASKLVLVAANYTNEAKESKILLKNAGDKKLHNSRLFLTNEFANLSKQNINLSSGNIIVPAHSVITYTADISSDISSASLLRIPEFKAFFNKGTNEVVVEVNNQKHLKKISIFNTLGVMVHATEIERDQKTIRIPSARFSNGMYMVVGNSDLGFSTEKVMVIK